MKHLLRLLEKNYLVKYFNVNNRWCNDSCRVFSDLLSDIYLIYYSSDYYAVSINKYGAKCGTSLRFWED